MKNWTSINTDDFDTDDMSCAFRLPHFTKIGSRFLGLKNIFKPGVKCKTNVTEYHFIGQEIPL